MGNAADEDFGRGVRALRREKGLTQEALADRSDLSVDAVPMSTRRVRRTNGRFERSGGS